MFKKVLESEESAPTGHFGNSRLSLLKELINDGKRVVWPSLILKLSRF